MTIVRLFVSEPFGSSEWVHYRLPVRIGRHPDYECQLIHPALSRFHLELDWAKDRLVLRDLGQRSVLYVRVAGEMRELCGRELTTAAREIEFAIAGVWVRASVEERRVHYVTEAVQEAIEQLMRASTHAATLDDQSRALVVLAALARGAVSVRGALHAARERCRAEAPAGGDEVMTAFMRWAQALDGAIRHVEDVLHGGEAHGVDQIA